MFSGFASSGFYDWTDLMWWVKVFAWSPTLMVVVGIPLALAFVMMVLPAFTQLLYDLKHPLKNFALVNVGITGDRQKLIEDPGSFREGLRKDGYQPLGVHTASETWLKTDEEGIVTDTKEVEFFKQVQRSPERGFAPRSQRK